QPLAELCRRRPGDVIVLTRIEVRAADLVVAAAPNDWDPAAHRKAALEVDAAFVLGEVGHEKTRETELGDHAVVDLLVVLQLLDANWLVASLLERQLDS